MITTDKLKGLGVAMITPFTKDGAIDENSLIRLTHDLIENGVDYLVLLGTTAETPTLNHQERNFIIKTVVREAQKRVPIIVGVASYSTQEVIDTIHSSNFDGIDAILSVTPYYNKPSQEGLYQHFKLISETSPVPVILYTIKSRTMVNLEPETTLRLAQLPNIIGVKEASGNLNQIMKIIKHKPEDFVVISGDDAITLPLLAVGIDGLISVIANAYPKQMVEMVHSAMNNHFDQAKEIHNQVLDITQACFKEGSPSGIKALMSIQNKIENVLRLPLMPVSDSLYQFFNENQL
jgi:4-hydroxy-tetrahydrodipicolinate synthase